MNHAAKAVLFGALAVALAAPMSAASTFTPQSAQDQETHMKRLIIATTIALGLACVCSVSTAQDQKSTTNLPNVTITEAPGQYETYVLNLPTGYGLEAFAGNTHRQYVQAQRAAETQESLRKRGIALQPFVAVAIDNSTGPGIAKQFQMIDSAQNTVAIVNAYCKRLAPAGGKRCQLVPQPTRADVYQRLASRQAGAAIQLTEVDQHP